MISVLIECDGQAAALASTLAALVPGAIEGLVMDVVVLDRADDAETARVADAAGCAYMAGKDLNAALSLTRGGWLMLLEPGARPMPGWIEHVGAHVGFEHRPARFRRSGNETMSVIARWKDKRSPLAHGLVLKKSQAAAMGGKLERLHDVARSVRAIKLDCAISTAGQSRALGARRDEA